MTLKLSTVYYPSQTSVNKGFFLPASWTVGFSLLLKNSDHLITFLWLCGFENIDHVCYSFALSTVVKSKQHSRKNKIQDLTSPKK